MRGIKAGIDEVKKANPNFVEIASKEAFRYRDLQIHAHRESDMRAWRAPKEARLCRISVSPGKASLLDQDGPRS